jgi:hypothetical protein
MLRMGKYEGWTTSNKDRKGRHQWLTPVILVTQEAEIRRIMVTNQPQAN